MIYVQPFALFDYMKKITSLSIFLTIALCSGHSFAQQNNFRDSVWVSVLPKYDSVSRLHRWVFGENYRKEYAMKAKLPVIAISKIAGGLKVLQLGGGNQSKSLRLIDPSGNEWTLRSVEKYPEVLLPKALQETFLRDVIKDNMSAQHPFSALVVATLAQAIGAAHSSPVIGLVAADANLGIHEKDFVNTVALLELREPWGKTDNSEKMYKKLAEDNDNTVDAPALLQLKCLDVLIGDWDRHDDQWRWLPQKQEKGIRYIPVPRDRDQVFFSAQGKIQRLSQSSWSLPMMQGYERGLQNINWFLWEGREINSRWFNEMDLNVWNTIVKDFCSKMTDSVFEQALLNLPEPGYSLRREKLLKELKSRRSLLPELMEKYYRFFNKIVDIELSHKHELVSLRDTLNGKLVVDIAKLKGLGVEKQLFFRVLDPKITREIRIYLHNGEDKIFINYKNSTIRTKIIGGTGDKSYVAEQVGAKTHLYDLKGRTIAGQHAHKIRKTLDNDSLNTSYQPKEIYSRHYILPNLGFNNDDGIAIGLMGKFTRPGFRKKPYASVHTISALYSAATNAANLTYRGEWLKAIGNADFVLDMKIYGPSNTQNFFGTGNQTVYDRERGISYYRARFDLYEFNPGLRWQTKGSSFSVGARFQLYQYHPDDNIGRLIGNPTLRHSADSSIVEATKAFAGVSLAYQYNTRKGNILPTEGILVDLKMNAFSGLNVNSKSLVQFWSAFSIYQKIDQRGNFVLSDRIGGGVSFGQPAFYQSQFLGGQGNLSGYRLFRFAGDHSVYNNFEARLRLGKFAKYIFAGEVGILGLYDVGRVWANNEQSKVLHHGFGAGAYLSPAAMMVIRFNANFSKEGFFPVFAMAWRY